MRRASLLRLVRIYSATVILTLIALCQPQIQGQTPPIRIMPLGDSITNGSGGTSNMGGYRLPLYNALTAAGYHVDFVGTQTGNSSLIPDQNHQGHSGWRIAQLTTNMEDWLAAIDYPDVVLLHIGTNDFGGNDNTPAAIDRLDTLINRIANRRPHANIIVTNLMERGGTYSGGETMDSRIQAQFNAFVEARVAAHATAGRKVTFLNMRAAVPLSDMPDQLHPNQAGYDKMAAAWVPAIQAVVTPLGNNLPPAVASAKIIATTDSNGSLLHQVEIIFSKPVADSAATASNYSHPGVVVGTPTLSSDKRRVTMNINLVSQPRPDTIPLTINNIQDRQPIPLSLPANTQATLTWPTQRGYHSHVSESTDYTLVYTLDVPLSPNYGGIGAVPYPVDNSSFVGQFDRVAYYMELQKPDGDLEYAWASMDAFTTDVKKVGVPVSGVGASFETNVTNLNVISNVSGVTTVQGAAGNIEFWPTNYSAGANSSIGGNASTYDFDDTPSPGTYGSMQVHNTTDKKTVIAFNNWGSTTGTTPDLGIGNAPAPVNNGLDWTFANNGGAYIVRRIQVLVRAGGDETAPTALSATATNSGNRIYVKFSEPLHSSSIATGNFTLDHGVKVVSVSQTDNLREVILTTTPQPSGTPLTLTLNNLRDTSPRANVIAPGTTLPVAAPALPPEIIANVGAAANGYQLVYSMDIPVVGNFISKGARAYSWDDSDAPGAFSRIAYYVELQRPGQASQYVWVSADAFTYSRKHLGVPVPSTGAIFQRILSNMEVISNSPNVTNGSNIATGNIEFWPRDYSAPNGIGIPNASPTAYDFGDTISTGGSHGSMQIHNHGNSQTIFGLSHFGSDGFTMDLGIGTNTTANQAPDWTNVANAGIYSKRVLHVLVLPSAGIPLPTEVAEKNIPDAEGYQLVYSLDIPEKGNMNPAVYAVDHSSLYNSFSRVAYYMELQTGSNAPQYVWASMDAFTTDAKKIGVPTPASGAVWQQRVWNMNVASNVPGVTSGNGITTGNMEFWPTDYTFTRDAAQNLNGSDTRYDFDDTRRTTGSYGSMQLHNYGAGHTLFAVNSWGTSGNTTNIFGLGLGNRANVETDWTFAANSNTYSRRVLHVFVLPGPSPDNTAPAIQRVVGSTTLDRLAVLFTKPVSDASADIANFNIPGLTVLSATLAPNQKDIILTTSPQTGGTTYTVSVSGVQDRTAAAHALASGASGTFKAYERPALLDSIPASNGYELAYQVAIPAARPQWNINDIPYTVEEARFGAKQFRSVAYLLELDSKWVWVSFDPHTHYLHKIGIPTSAVSTTAMQQYVENMLISSNIPEANFPTPTSGMRGNIEFWSGNYSGANALNIPNATSAFDWGDTMSAGAHGSMQIHNHQDSQVVFAFNNWSGNAGAASDLGIGNRPTGNVDWTSSDTSTNYTVRNLYVFTKYMVSLPIGEVKDPDVTILMQPSSITEDLGSDATFSVLATSSGPLTYQWFFTPHNEGYSNPIPGATKPWLDITDVSPQDRGTYKVLMTSLNGFSRYSNSVTLAVTNTVPTFSGYRITVTKDQQTPIDIQSIRAKAQDADGDSVIFSLPALNSTTGTTAGGSYVRKHATLDYTPPASFTGQDQIPLTIQDQRSSATVPGTVQITVIDAAPSAPGRDGIKYRTDSKVDAVFHGTPGQSYEIQRTTDLLNPTSWTTITTVSAGDDGLIPFHDPNPPPDRAFYRTKEVPPAP